MGDFSDRFKELVPERPRGWQAELASKFGISKPTMSEWASGEIKRLDPTHLFKVADHFGVHARWLAFGVGPKWLREPAFVPPRPIPTIKESISALHAACLAVDPDARAELRKLFDLYLGDPTRYGKLLSDIEAWLSGELSVERSNPKSEAA